MKPIKFKLVGLLCLALLLSGCATQSLFNSYPKQVMPVKAALMDGHYEQASNEVFSKTGGADKILYLMEYGRIEQLAGHFESSEKAFKMAIAAITENQDKAKITASGVVAQSSAVLVNDNVLPYEGHPYEHVLLHQYQAFNYIGQNNLSGALVEIRRADRLQRQEKDRHQKRLNQVNAELSQQKLKNPLNFNESQFRFMNAAAAKVKNQFLDAYTFYVSGILYQAAGKTSDAYIDFKKALGIAPNNTYLQNTALTLAIQLGRSSDISSYKKRFPNAKVVTPKANQGQLVVLYEQGFIPLRHEISFPILLNAGIVPVSLPVYIDDVHTTPPLSINQKGGVNLGQTQVLLNLQSLSAKALKDAYPGIVLRAVLRFTAKATLEHIGKEKGGDLGQIAANIYAFLTSAADLRSWATLPNDVQVMHSPINRGQQKINLTYKGHSKTITVTVYPKRITLVWAVNQLGHLSYHVFNL